MGLLTSKIKCGNTFFTHYYVCPYLPRIAGTDALSHSLLKFKQRIQPDLDAWIDCSVQLLGALPFSPDTIILRALRHDEMTARTHIPSALDLLGLSLAHHLGCHYLPSLLTKSRPTLPNKHLTRRQRQSQLHDVYHFSATHRTLAAPSAAAAATTADLPTPFLLIDDVLTTGTTMRTLIQTLLRNHPACSVKTFTLARADYRPASQRGEIDTTADPASPPPTSTTDPLTTLRSRLSC